MSEFVPYEEPAPYWFKIDGAISYISVDIDGSLWGCDTNNALLFKTKYN